MKKFIYSIATLFAIGFTANAQDIKFGVKAGLNIAKWGADAENTSGRAGFNAGVLAELIFSNNFAVQPEIVYSQQGTKRSINNYMGVELDNSSELTAKLNYINVPVALKYYIIEGLSLQAGPQIGFLVSANEVVVVKADGEDLSLESDEKNNYEKVDFALFGGIGYDLPIGVFFQARYSAGLSNINKDPDTADQYLTNDVFSFSVGYKF
jgi:hypothetical protein